MYRVINHITSKVKSRLFLPPKVRFRLVDFQVSYRFHPVMYHREQPILELFHSTNHKTNDIELLENGFHEDKPVWLSDHTRCCLSTGQSPLSVFVCYVIGDQQRLIRYKSLLYTPSTVYNNDYLVIRSELVHPKYLVRFFLEGEIQCHHTNTKQQQSQSPIILPEHIVSPAESIHMQIPHCRLMSDM